MREWVPNNYPACVEESRKISTRDLLGIIEGLMKAKNQIKGVN